jgi:hypothetical protein
VLHVREVPDENGHKVYLAVLIPGPLQVRKQFGSIGFVG